MSPTSQARPIAGSLVFDFENLYVLRESGAQRRCGRAVFAYDGKGAYWPVGLTLEAQAFGAPATSIPFGTGLWREVFRRLEQYHQDDIAARIAEDLTGKGGHMALFDEHPPSDAASFMPPPLVSAEARGARLLLGAAETCLELAALALLLAGILGYAMLAEAPRLGRHLAGPAPVVAALEVGDGR